MTPELPADAYPYLEEALPGFHRGRMLVKAAKNAVTKVFIEMLQRKPSPPTNSTDP